MHSTDKRIIRLIELLIFQNKISYIRDFCLEIDMQPQTITKIKKGQTHFTVMQIQAICTKYDVNANWIFGFDDKVFNTANSLKLAEVL
jgi:hypothetical protein